MDKSIVEHEIERIEKDTGKRLLTLAEAANCLGVKTKTVEKLISRGELYCSSSDDDQLISVISIARYLAGDMDSIGNIEKSIDTELVQRYPHQLNIEDIGEEEFEMIKNTKGLGSVYYHEGRNCWQAAFYMFVDGQKKRRIVSAPSEAEAISQMILIKSGNMGFTSEKDIPVPVQKHKIADIWNSILEIKKSKVKAGTYKWYQAMGKHITDEIGEVYIEDLDFTQVQKFLNTLKVNKNTGKESADKTIKEISTQLQKICSYAHIAGYVNRNPFNDNVERPRGIKKDPLDTVIDHNTLIDLIKATKGNPVFKTAVHSLLLTGLRIGEFLGLKWSDLDRENNRIFVNTSATTMYEEDEEGKFVKAGFNLKGTKTAASKRLIPVHPSFFEILDNWKSYVQNDAKRMEAIDKNKTADIIFINADGCIRSYQGLRKQFARFLKENGFSKGITFHCFRRTVATNMIDAGVRLEVVARYLGHEGEGHEVTRKHYAKVDLKPLEEAVEQYYEYMKDTLEQ